MKKLISTIATCFALAFAYPVFGDHGCCEHCTQVEHDNCCDDCDD